MKPTTKDDTAHGGKTSTAKVDLDASSSSETAPILYDLPVDSECKAKALKFYSWKRPHMRAFQCNWVSFFMTFFATFSPATLLPYIREDLNLTRTDVNDAGIAAVTGAIGARLVMGAVCDAFGPRYGHAFTQLLTAPATFCLAVVNSVGAFIAVRLVIGFSTGIFVATQFWSSVMFSPSIVGFANATAAGWGNAGAGFCQLLMPLIFTAIALSQPDFVAWRYAMFLPGFLQIGAGLLVLTFAQDLPLGNYAELAKNGEKAKANLKRDIYVAATNYRTWVLMLTYGYSFGVELTVNNVILTYYYDTFDNPFIVAGVFASFFGLTNFIARPLGGLLSDRMARLYGIRGRLWVLYCLQTCGGICCIVFGLLYNSLAGTIVLQIMFSSFSQSAAGATFGIVPFVSKRALGIVNGMVGGGGNAGSAINQAIFFIALGTSLASHSSFTYMGIAMTVAPLALFLMYFPMWGGMILPPRKNYDETDYYYAEYNESELQQGLHLNSSKFANESRSQRGLRRMQKEAMEASAP